MDKMQLLIVGALLGLGGTLIGTLFGATLAYVFAIKKYLKIQEIERRAEEEKRADELHSMLSDLSFPSEKEVRSLSKSLEGFESHNQKRETFLRRETLARTNIDSFTFYRDEFRRESLYTPDIHSGLRHFAEKIRMFENMGIASRDELSPFCGILLFLENFSTGLYEQAMSDLGRVEVVIQREVDNPTRLLYGSFPIDQVKLQLQRALDDCGHYAQEITSHQAAQKASPPEISIEPKR